MRSPRAAWTTPTPTCATLGSLCPSRPGTFQELREWAVDRFEKLLEQLPQCNHCGDTIWDLAQAIRLSTEGAYGDPYCSQKCAEDAYPPEADW